MNRLAYVTATLLIFALLMFAPVAGAQQQEDQGVQATPVAEVRSVFIEDNYFDPADAVVNSGATVLWVNQGAEPHTVTADDGSFDSGILNPGDAFLVTFEGSGTLTYHCSLHPEMLGSVTVEGGAGEATATEGTPPEETAPAEETTTEEASATDTSQEMYTSQDV